jgi:hypothetical protein
VVLHVLYVSPPHICNMSPELALAKAFGLPDGFGRYWGSELLPVLENLPRHARLAGVFDVLGSNQLMSTPTTLLLHLAHTQAVVESITDPEPTRLVPDAAARLSDLRASSQAMQPALQLYMESSASALLQAATRAIEAQHAHEHQVDARKAGLSWYTTTGLAATAAVGLKATVCGGDGRWGPAAFFAACAAVHLAGAAASEAYNRSPRSRLMARAKHALGRDLARLGPLLERLFAGGVLQPLAQLEETPLGSERHQQLCQAITIGVSTLRRVLATLTCGTFYAYDGVTTGRVAVKHDDWWELLLKGWQRPACLLLKLASNPPTGPCNQALRWWWAYGLLCRFKVPAVLPWALLLWPALPQGAAAAAGGVST